MEPNQSNDNHAHTMRNILIPIIVVVALIIVSIFFSENSAFKSLGGQSAAVGSAVQTKVPTTPSSPAREVWFVGGTVGQACVVWVFDDVTGNQIDEIFGTQQADYSCADVVIDNNSGPITKTYKVFGSKITAKHYSVLQAYLSSKGYLEQGYNTAKRDLKTRTALKAYQKSIGVTASGSLSAATKAKLNMEISQQMKPAMKAVDDRQTTDQEKAIGNNGTPPFDQVTIQNNSSEAIKNIPNIITLQIDRSKNRVTVNGKPITTPGSTANIIQWYWCRSLVGALNPGDNSSLNGGMSAEDCDYAYYPTSLW